MLFRAHGPATAWRWPASFLRLTLQTRVEEPGGATPAQSSYEARASLHPPLQPSWCLAQSHWQCLQAPVRALIMDVVKGEKSESVPYHPCDPPPHLFLQELLSPYIKLGAVAILSFTQPIHKCSPAPVMGSSLWGHNEKQDHMFPRLVGLIFFRINV